MMKKILRIVAIVILLSVVGIILYGVIINEKEPEGIVSDEAEQMAEKILDNLNYDQWLKTTWVQWDFLGQHQYIWDRERDVVQVSWKDHRVLLNLQDLNSSLCYGNSKKITSTHRQTMIDDAWSYFCNDSFWLIAPYKLLDPGTRHSIVELDGKTGLKVKYTDGGVTPGDAYLWFTENDRPTSYRMWTSIIPVGGIEVTWENWEESKTGAIFSTRHESDLFSMEFDDIKTGHIFEDLGITADPFAELF